MKNIKLTAFDEFAIMMCFLVFFMLFVLFSAINKMNKPIPDPAYDARVQRVLEYERTHSY